MATQGLKRNAAEEENSEATTATQSQSEGQSRLPLRFCLPVRAVSGGAKTTVPVSSKNSKARTGDRQRRPWHTSLFIAPPTCGFRPKYNL